MCFFTRLYERIKAFFLDDEYDRHYEFRAEDEELDSDLLWDDADFEDSCESCALETANVELPVKKPKKKKSKKKTVKKVSKSKKKAAKKK